MEGSSPHTAAAAEGEDEGEVHDSTASPSGPRLVPLPHLASEVACGAWHTVVLLRTTPLPPPSHAAHAAGAVAARGSTITGSTRRVLSCGALEHADEDELTLADEPLLHKLDPHASASATAAAAAAAAVAGGRRAGGEAEDVVEDDDGLEPLGLLGVSPERPRLMNAPAAEPLPVAEEALVAAEAAPAAEPEAEEAAVPGTAEDDQKVEGAAAWSSSSAAADVGCIEKNKKEKPDTGAKASLDDRSLS